MCLYARLSITGRCRQLSKCSSGCQDELLGRGHAVANSKLDGVLAAVKLKKCRYLEQSGCVGSCTNFCKVPTENFFKEAFGVDAHLQPNHADGSCVLTFGEKLSDEEIFSAPCYLTCKSRKLGISSGGGVGTIERDDGSVQQPKCWKLP